MHYVNTKENNYSEKYELVKIGKFLKRNKTPIEVQDNQLYKRVTIRINGGGISVRDEVFGKEIGTKNQFEVTEKQFLLSKIDARNGAFGVVPMVCDKAIITGNFWTFDVDYSIVNPNYLTLFTATKHFQHISQTASTGTTNRNYLQENLFLEMPIPLPSLDIQNQLVTTYQNKLNQAQEAANKALELEKGIETYLLEVLRIEMETEKTLPKNSQFKFLQMVDFKEISRWDCDFLQNQSIGIFAVLKKAKYKAKKLGEVYQFVNQSWAKQKHKEKTFNYIEIGSIDVLLGVTSFTEIEVANAPSRATQIVKENDLILGLTRPYLKKFALISEKHNGYVCSSGFQVISPSENYSLEFLLEFLKSDAGVKQFEFYMTGALYPAITTKQLQDLEIPLPPRHK